MARLCSIRNVGAVICLAACSVGGTWAIAAYLAPTVSSALKLKGALAFCSVWVPEEARTHKRDKECYGTDVLDIPAPGIGAGQLHKFSFEGTWFRLTVIDALKEIMDDLTAWVYNCEIANPMIVDVCHDGYCS